MLLSFQPTMQICINANLYYFILIRLNLCKYELILIRFRSDLSITRNKFFFINYNCMYTTVLVSGIFMHNAFQDETRGKHNL